MARRNPSDTAREGSTRQSVTPGEKVVIGVGLRGDYNGSNERVWKVFYLVLADNAVEGPGCTGAMHLESYLVRDSMAWKLSAVSIAAGFTDPYDDEVESDIQRITCSKPFILPLEHDDYLNSNRKRRDPEGHRSKPAILSGNNPAPYLGPVDPTWNALIAEGREQAKRMFAKFDGGDSRSAPAPPPSDGDEIPF